MFVLAVDAGASACRAGVFSSGGLMASATRVYEIVRPQPGYLEVDAEAIWGSVKEAVREAVQLVDGRAMRAVSFSSMGEMVVPVGKDGKVLGPCILPYDVRGAEYVDRFLKHAGKDETYTTNPSIMGRLSSLSKILWLRDNEPELYKNTDKFLFLGDYLGFKFGAEPYSTESLACRSLLFDVRNGVWSERLLSLAGIDPEKFAPVVPSGKVVGTVPRQTAQSMKLSARVSIVTGGYDQCCGALGGGCRTNGSVIVSMGTYESYCPVFSWPSEPESFSREGMCIERHILPDLYMSYLYHHSGSLVSWFSSVFAKAEQPVRRTNIFEIFDREAPSEPTRLLFVPNNEVSPWPSRTGGVAGGVFAGMRIDTTRGEMYRALLEGISFFFVDVLEALARVGLKPGELFASGTGARSDVWMQIRADVTGLPFTRLAVVDGGLVGAGILAGVAVNLYSGIEDAVDALVTRERVFEPDSVRHAYYGERLELQRRLSKSFRPIAKKL